MTCPWALALGVGVWGMERRFGFFLLNGFGYFSGQPNWPKTDGILFMSILYIPIVG